VRILFACEFYHPSRGGVQEVMRQLAERLAERGHEVTVATTYLTARQERVLNSVRIKEFRVSGNMASGIAGEVDSFRDYVLNGDYDILMVKAAQQWTFDALVPVLDRITRPKVFVPCGFSGLFEPAFADYFHRMPELLRKFDHLVFYASDYRDINFARAHGLSNYIVLSNGASEREFLVSADRDFRRRHGIAENAFVMLTVGTLNGLKGHRELAEAFEHARLPDLSVLILNGNKAERAPLGRLVAQFPRRLRNFYRTGGVIRIAKWILRPLLLRARLGWLLERLGYKPALDALVARINRGSPGKRIMLTDLTRNELVQAYLNSNLFVFASNVEYSPLVLYEAAAAGLPFLSVPVGNAEEIAHWTGGGEICPAPQDAQGYTRVDPRVLAERMQALSSNSEKLKALGEAGRRNWLDRFTWEKITTRYEDLFNRLLAEKAGNAGAPTRLVARQSVSDA
jgi:glycosyltransferase involved in cell wall biosynthesis